MEHIEDSLWNEGSAGVFTATSFLSSVVDMLSGNATANINVTVKWDGAPAVFAGIDPETSKFFVATKSLFNVTPKSTIPTQTSTATIRGNLPTN